LLIVTGTHSRRRPSWPGHSCSSFLFSSHFTRLEWHQVRLQGQHSSRLKTGGQAREQGECVRVHWYTMSKQSGNEWQGPADRRRSDTVARVRLCVCRRGPPTLFPFRLNLRNHWQLSQRSALKLLKLSSSRLRLPRFSSCLRRFDPLRAGSCPNCVPRICSS